MGVNDMQQCWCGCYRFLGNVANQGKKMEGGKTGKVEIGSEFCGEETALKYVLLNFAHKTQTVLAC